MLDRPEMLLDVKHDLEHRIRGDHAAAGLKLFSAISLVGAMMRSSALCRQLRISAVSMIPAAIVDFEFFLLMSRRNSRMSRLPALRVVRAEDGADEVENPFVASLAEGRLPGHVDHPERLEHGERRFPSSGKSGANGTSDLRSTIRRSQSGQAVDQAGPPIPGRSGASLELGDSVEVARRRCSRASRTSSSSCGRGRP
jgi:hypothetical protein